MSFGKFLLLPALIRSSITAPRSASAAWDGYWDSIKQTGNGGQVLWDSASDVEIERCVELLRKHLDVSLPIVDVGCGNGRFTRILAATFTSALGIDLSPRAIDLAWKESAGHPRVTFRALDAAASDAARTLSSHVGEANVFVRGVLHVLDHRSRLRLIENLAHVLVHRRPCGIKSCRQPLTAAWDRSSRSS